MNKPTVYTAPTLRKGPNEHALILPGIIRVKLTRGKHTVVNSSSWPSVSMYRWCAVLSDSTWYAQTEVRVPGRNRYTLKLHQFLAQAPDGMVIDHIDGDGLNNLLNNLRVVNPRANSQNRHQSKTSQYPGVTWHKRAKKWCSSIQYNGITYHLGVFNEEREAFEIYAKYSADADCGNFIAPCCNKTSRVAGVHYCFPKMKWIARKTINGKRVCLGHFSTESEAVAARHAAA